MRQVSGLDWSPSVWIPSNFLSRTFPVFATLQFHQAWTMVFCAGGVTLVSSVTNSLVTTFLVTIRKFITVLISSIYFQDTYSPLFWVGVVSVLVGSVTFVSSVKITPRTTSKDNVPTSVKGIRHSVGDSAVPAREGDSNRSIGRTNGSSSNGHSSKKCNKSNRIPRQRRKL